MSKANNQQAIIKILEKYLGESKKSGRGWQRAFTCPRCKHGKNLEVNIDDIRKPLLHCWYCELKPRTLQGLARSYLGAKALEEIEQLVRGSRGLEEVSRPLEKPPLELPRDYQFVSSSTSLEGRDALYYLNSRGIDSRIIREHYLGISRELPGRIIIPSFDDQFELNMYVARGIDNNLTPRYINSPGSKDIIFNHNLLDFSSLLILVEGPFDMMKVRSIHKNTTCLLGSSLSKKSRLFTTIVKNKTPIVLALDNDARAKAASIAKNLLLNEVELYMINSTSEEDLGATSLKEIECLLKKKRRVEDSISLVPWILRGS